MNPTLINLLLALPRPLKRLIALGLDASICVFSVYLAFYLRLGEWVSLWGAPTHPSLASVAIALPIFVSFGLYRAIFRYAGWEAILSIARAVTVYGLLFAFIYTAVGVYAVPRTIGLIQPILLFLLIASSRLFARGYLGPTYQALWKSNDAPRVLIYGAGAAGRQLSGVLRSGRDMILVGFVDDDSDLWRSTVNETPVYGPSDLPAIIARKSITDILLAVPSASRTRRSEILRELRNLGVRVRTLPGLMDVARGEASVQDLRDVEVEDLLGRQPVPPDESLLREEITGRTILVTGAGGSIGSELSRQISASAPRRLLLLDTNEFGLYSIHQELIEHSASHGMDSSAIVPLLGSVCDETRMRAILGEWQPDIIFHAAAYKHVPMVERNILEGIRNNVFGTLVLAQLAKDYACKKFILISTDKAVRPTSIMGASKRVAELILQAINRSKQATCFSMVRFGNVLGSSGSVVPLFRSQIGAGGPITITHEAVTRYFMTIPEAAQLVVQAGAMATGGEVFLLDMGEPVKIVDLARSMIELSGLKVKDGSADGDIEIQVIGLRPGEKLYEELLIDSQSEDTRHPRIKRARERSMSWAKVSEQLNRLDQAIAQGDCELARAILGVLVPEFGEQVRCSSNLPSDDESTHFPAYAVPPSRDTFPSVSGALHSPNVGC